LHTADGRPIHTADARVMLAGIPFVRLRDGLPREALAHGAPFAALVESAQAALVPPTLEFDFARREALCSGRRIRMQPGLLAWYAWLAECRRTGAGHNGFVRDGDATPERLLTIHMAIAGRVDEATRRALTQGFEPQQFQQKAAKINRVLDQVLSLAAAPYRVGTWGNKPLTRYGIALDPAHISPLPIAPQHKAKPPL
jgi:hypothetical protein